MAWLLLFTLISRYFLLTLNCSRAEYIMMKIGFQKVCLIIFWKSYVIQLTLFFFVLFPFMSLNFDKELKWMQCWTVSYYIFVITIYVSRAHNYFPLEVILAEVAGLWIGSTKMWIPIYVYGALMNTQLELLQTRLCKHSPLKGRNILELFNSTEYFC